MDANLYLLPHKKDRTRFVDRSRSRAALMAAEEISETFSYMKLVNHPLIWVKIL